MRLLALAGYPERLARAFAGLFAGARTLGAVGLDGAMGPVRGPLIAGGTIENFWERANAEGLAVHPLSVLVQHDDLREALGRIFETGTPLCFFCRFGRPLAGVPPAPKAKDPRRAVVEF